MTVGVADQDKIFYSAATGLGNPIVYVGSKTGRDGIHGATMASADFGEDAEAKRPTVQVGDPFMEKLLLEACLELMATDAIVAIQDMGAAGLTSSSFEMASKGGVGIDLDLDRVPVRETGMTAYEIMLSESQERMLMVLRPGREEDARAIFVKWGLDFAVVGRITETGRVVIRHQGETVVDLPIAPLADAAPVYERPWSASPPPPLLDRAAIPELEDPIEALVRLLGSPDLSSKRWIWEQYDHMVMAATVQRPGGDAAVVRIDPFGLKAVALTTDCTPRYCRADPETGGRQAVAEAWRNLTAVGARPLAITDCLNFGNPEKPEIMGQFALCVTGMAEACRALDFPVVSGNVSLYNETEGQPVLPTPTVGAVGLIGDLTRMATLALKPGDQVLLCLGSLGPGWLGQSLYLREIGGREEGAPPPVDLDGERRTGDLVRALIEDGIVATCHDIGDGGLLVAVAEMALAGGIGATIGGDASGAGFLFGEDQGRYLVAVVRADRDQVLARAAAAAVEAREIGTVGGERLTLAPTHAISLRDLRRVHERWMPEYMGA
jgi:phosphoribosylformylglycinamidine synthase